MPRAVAEAAGRHIGRPVADPADKIEYAQLLKAQGESLGKIVTKTGIPKASLHRYLSEPPTVFHRRAPATQHPHRRQLQSGHDC